MRNKKLKRLISPALLLLAAMIWGFAFTAQSKAESVPPFTLGAVRSIFAFVFLIFAVIIFDKVNNTNRRLIRFCQKKIKVDVNAGEILGGIILGIILALASFFQQAGINMGADPGKAAFITALYVVLVPIYALFIRRRAPINVWISVAIAAIGFYLLCIKGDFSIAKEDIFVLVCSLIFPIHILTIDFFLPKCDGIRMSMIQFLSCGITNITLALIFERGTDITLILSAILPLLYLGVCSSGIAYTLQIIGQKGVNPAAASVIMSLESVFGVLGSALLIGTQMSGREYIGCAVVFVAVILSQIDFTILFEKEIKK